MIGFSFANLNVPIGLPDSIEDGGEEYPIRTDFRRILYAMKAMGDANITPRDRMRLVKHALYPERVPAQPWTAVLPFIRCGKDAPDETGDRDFDYEQDAAEIYSAFMQVYGIDLFAIPELHWWRFCALLDGIFSVDNALSAKVRLRHMDDGKQKQKAAMERAKKRAALAEEISGAEASIERQMRERLRAGLPVDDLMRR